MPLARIIGGVIGISAVATVIASFFALYTASVSPSDFDDGSAYSSTPGGSITIEMGFFDTVPFAAPIIAVAIPLLMILAGAAAVPMVMSGRARLVEPIAIATVTSAVVGVLLMAAGPLPGLTLSGSLARQFRREVGYSDFDDAIGDLIPISPGAGLIVAFVFSVIAAAAAVTLYVFTVRYSDISTPIAGGAGTASGFAPAPATTTRMTVPGPAVPGGDPPGRLPEYGAVPPNPTGPGR